MSSDDIENRVVKLETEMTQIRTDIGRLGAEAKERRGECRDTMKKITEDLTKIRNNDLIHIQNEINTRRGFSRKEWVVIAGNIIMSFTAIAVALISRGG